MAVEDDDFVDKSSQGSASKSKGAKDDSKFVHPLPLSPKPTGKSSGPERVSESEDSTAVSGRNTETDESYQNSHDVTSEEDLLGLHSDPQCGTEE